MKHSTCLYCQTDFSYSPHQRRGFYCSNDCSGKHKSELHKQNWLEGKLLRVERATLRKYLTEERGYKCEVCEISEWQGKPLTLQVDHIDGNPADDSPNNLRLICPNCHSQTPSFGGANKGSGRAARGLPLN